VQKMADGDTETVQWRFYGSDAASDAPLVLLGEVHRKGFETSLTVPKKLARVHAEAISKERHVLTSTRVERTELEAPSHRKQAKGEMGLMFQREY
jgi:uncharacterized protein (DUF849 family)